MPLPYSPDHMPLPLAVPEPSTWSIIWPDLVKGMPAAFVALVIGGIAAYVAWRQYRVARAKLKLDLFDKRYAIYLETWKTLSAIVMHGTRETNYGLATPFNNFIPQTRFLFGSEMEAYLQIAAKKWTALRGLTAERAIFSAAQNAERQELEAWFFEQANTTVKEKFSKYLDFSKWT